MIELSFENFFHGPCYFPRCSLDFILIKWLINYDQPVIRYWSIPIKNNHLELLTSAVFESVFNENVCLLQEEEIGPYVDDFDTGVKDDVLMIGSISLEEVQVKLLLEKITGI